jgi:hypothetical protein
MGVKLDIKHWCDHLAKLVETGHEVKVTILWNHANQPNYY